MLRSKASSKAAVATPGTGRDPALAQLKNSWMLDLDHSQFDLLTVLTYLGSVSTANLGREQIFESAARLGYDPSPYFAQVVNLVQSLGYDYSHACHVVSKGAKDQVMRQFLLRFGNSMASGEPEVVFLEREAQVLMEDYTNEYERAIESLKKWTDAFVALMVSCNLIVLVSLISNMIYNLGSLFMLMVEAVALIAAAMGAYLIYRIAPYDPVVHNLPVRSEEQDRMSLFARILFPVSALAGVRDLFRDGQHRHSACGGPAFSCSRSACSRSSLERKIDARDRDIADFLRALGGVTAARGSTVIDSLNHIDQRAIGSLEPELQRLMTRVSCGLSTGRAWYRFMADTGSELVHRVVRAFWDGNDWGGQPERIGGVLREHGDARLASAGQAEARVVDVQLRRHPHAHRADRHPRLHQRGRDGVQHEAHRGAGCLPDGEYLQHPARRISGYRTRLLSSRSTRGSSTSWCWW